MKFFLFVSSCLLLPGISQGSEIGGGYDFNNGDGHWDLEGGPGRPAPRKSSASEHELHRRIQEVTLDFAGGVEHPLSRVGTGEEIIVSVENAGQDLCSKVPGAWRTLFFGKRCLDSNPNQIEWHSVQTIDEFGNVLEAAKDAWPCTWSRDADHQDNPKWLEAFLGSCGVSPTYNDLAEKLPTEVYTLKVRNQEEDLCFEPGEATVTTVYEGFPCGKDDSLMIWNSMRTIDSPSCMWLRDGPGLHGATDPDFVQKYLGTGCGEAPAVFEGVLPTDSATVIAKAKKEKTKQPAANEAKEHLRKLKEHQITHALTMSKAYMLFLQGMMGNFDDEEKTRSIMQMTPSQNATSDIEQRRLEFSTPTWDDTTPADQCSIAWVLRKLMDAFLLLLPDELLMKTEAQNLEYMLPCNDLPLTRLRDDGTVPVFGYFAVYSYLWDVFRAMVRIITLIVQTSWCLIGGATTGSQPPSFVGWGDQALDFIHDLVQGTAGGPKLDFIPRRWINPNNCVDNQNGIQAVSCSGSKPCCSYPIAGQNAEFHPLCNSMGVCDMTNSTQPSCYKNGGPCKTGADCCQKQDSIVICKKANVNDATGTCQDAPPQPVGWNPFCLAYSEKSFAFTFKRPFPPLKFDPTGKLGSLFPNEPDWVPGFPPPNINPAVCHFANGIPVPLNPLPADPLVKTIKIRGFGVGWGQDLAYGSNAATRGTEYGHSVPTVWDGYLRHTLPQNPGTEVWLAFRFNLIPMPAHLLGVAKCVAYMGGPSVEKGAFQVKSKLQLKVDFELYVETGAQAGSDTCIILAMTDMSIKVSNFELVFGRGLGGWCKNKGSCAPSGFFLNVEPTFDIKMAGESVISAIMTGLAFADSKTSATLVPPQGSVQLDGGVNLGIIQDPNRNMEVTAFVFRGKFPSVKIMGQSLLSGSQGVIQWFKGSEMNRRISTILKINGVANCPVLTANCHTWKPYERVVGGYDVYNGTAEICEERLLDMDQYNRIMTVSETKGTAALPQRIQYGKTGHITKWYNNAKFDQYAYPDSDNVIYHLSIGIWATPVLMLTELSLTFILQVEGNVNIQGPVSENMTPAEIANVTKQLEATFNSTSDKEVDVYVEIYMLIEVAFLAGFEAAASMQNNPDGLGSYDSWVVAAMFSVSLRFVGEANFFIQSSPFKFGELPAYTVTIDFIVDLGAAIRQGVEMAYQALVVRPAQYVVQKLKAAGEFLVEEFKDSLFSATPYQRMKDIANRLAAIQSESIEQIEAALEARDYDIVVIESVTLLLEEIQARVDLINAYANAALITIQAINEAAKAFAGSISDGLIAVECVVNVCYEDTPSTQYTYLAGQDSVDEHGCTVKWHEAVSCCQCKTGIALVQCGMPIYLQCHGSCSSHKEKYAEYDLACQDQAKAAKIRAEAELAKAKIEKVKTKVVEIDNYMYMYRVNSDAQTKGLKAAVLDPASLGSPTVSIPQVAVATAGVQDNQTSIKAFVEGLPRLKAGSTNISFTNDDLTGDEVIEMMFFLKPGETNSTAQERIEREIEEIATSRAMKKVLGGIKLSTSLSSFMHSPSYSEGAYMNRQEASDACQAEGLQLCSKEEIKGFHKCSEGWLADDKGFWLDFNMTGCSGLTGFNAATQAHMGVYCCPVVPELRKESELTTYDEARDECLRVGKRLCDEDELIGFGSCTAGFTFMGSKSWWTPVSGTCGVEGLNSNATLSNAGAYCCAQDKPTYLPEPSRAAYASRKEASDACAQHGMQLCSKDMLFGFELCSSPGWLADDMGFWSHGGCVSSAQGWNPTTDASAGAYCCAVQPELVEESALNSHAEAVMECAKIDKKLCSPEQLLGFERCKPGFVSDGSKSWYMAESGVQGCGSDGLNSDPSKTQVGAYCCEDNDDRPHYLPDYPGSEQHPYIYTYKEEASQACASRGLQLCKKADIARLHWCGGGWLADGKGFYSNGEEAGCGQPGFNSWSNAAGAFCCPTVPTYVEQANLTMVQDARIACKSINKGLCFSEQVVGYDMCNPGFTGEGLKSWWMSHSGASGCQSEGLNAKAASTQVGAYCCENTGPYYIPEARSRADPYIYASREEASKACQVKSLQLCTIAEITGFDNCFRGWLADGQGLFMEKARVGCGAVGFNNRTEPTAGAYCCDQKPELIKASSLTKFAQAEAECTRLDKVLCSQDQLIGYERCFAGFVSEGTKSWWMSHSRKPGFCGSEGLNTDNSIERVGAYCCQKP